MVNNTCASHDIKLFFGVSIGDHIRSNMSNSSEIQRWEHPSRQKDGQRLADIFAMFDFTSRPQNTIQNINISNIYIYILNDSLY